MSRQRPFEAYIRDQRTIKEKYLADRLAGAAPPKEYDPVIAGCYDDLAVICRIQGDVDACSLMQRNSASFGTLGEKTAWFADVDLTNENNPTGGGCGSRSGYLFFHIGLNQSLAGVPSGESFRMFEYAERCCTLDPGFASRNDRFARIITAFSCLWKGYSLLCLGRYDEASPFLSQVGPIYRAVKAHSTDDPTLSAVIEMSLTKVLVPVCEYKRDPTDLTLARAQDGMDEFLFMIHDNMFRLRAYAYYYHLTDLFPEISTTAGTGSAARSPRESSRAQDPVPVTPSDLTRVVPGTGIWWYEIGGPGQVTVREQNSIRGSVFVCDPEIVQRREYLCSNPDFMTFIGYVTAMNAFPAIESLIDFYTTGQCRTARPITRECERLSAVPGVDSRILAISRKLNGCAREAADEDSVIMLDYDPSVDPGPDIDSFPEIPPGFRNEPSKNGRQIPSGFGINWRRLFFGK